MIGFTTHDVGLQSPMFPVRIPDLEKVLPQIWEREKGQL